MSKLFLASMLLLSSNFAFSADLQIAGFEFAPLTIVDGNHLSGIGYDVVSKMIKASGDVEKGMITGSVKRMIELAPDANIIFPMITRTPDREDKFTWIGKIAEDTNCFYAPKEKPVNNIEDAKKLDHVGVNAGGATEKFLTENGFKNIDPVANNSLNFKKLEAGRIAAWYTSEMVSKYTTLKEKGDLAKYICGGSIKKSAYWVAASLKTDAGTVTMLKGKFADLEKAGEISKIIGTYLK